MPFYDTGFSPVIAYVRVSAFFKRIIYSYDCWRHLCNNNKVLIITYRFCCTHPYKTRLNIAQRFSVSCVVGRIVCCTCLSMFLFYIVGNIFSRKKSCENKKVGEPCGSPLYQVFTNLLLYSAVSLIHSYVVLGI